MNALIWRISQDIKIKEYTYVKNKQLIDYNTKKHDIFIRLNFILFNERKSESYKQRVFLLFSYFLFFLEKIGSKTIHIITKSNIKYYYSSKLQLKDAEKYYLNTNLKDSTKLFYLTLLKKYIKKLNRNSKIKFSKSTNSIKSKSKKGDINFNVKEIIQKFKTESNYEIFCSFYVLYFMGLSFYQYSKLNYKNYNKNKNTITFVSYKFRKKVIKKTKNIKVMRQ